MIVLPLEGNAQSVWYGGQIKEVEQLAYFDIEASGVHIDLSDGVGESTTPARVRRSKLIQELALKNVESAMSNDEAGDLDDKQSKSRIARAKMIAQLAAAAAKDKPKPTPKKITAPVRQSSDSASGGQFIANISAYTAAFDETDSGDGITASGKRVKANHTIACPRSYPFGTRIKVEGYGTYTCEDRGGAIKGNKFDIYVVTKSEAFAFGRRNLPVSVVE